SAPAARPSTPTPAPTATPSILGSGSVSMQMWVQDFDPAIAMFQRVAKTEVDKAKNLQVTVQPVPYTDLMAKMLPSTAAGTEGEVLMGYTDWYVATDISKPFLPLDDVMGGRGALEQQIFPSALRVLDTPGGKVFYVPWAAGIRAAIGTVNVKQYQDAGIDYLKFGNFEDVVEAGRKLQKCDGGNDN